MTLNWKRPLTYTLRRRARQASKDKLNQAQEKIKVLTADSETLIDPEHLGSAADV